MKKFFMISVVVSAVMGFGYGVINNSQISNSDNALSITNIEALTGAEVIPGWDTCCKPGGDGCCPDPMYWLPYDNPC